MIGKISQFIQIPVLRYFHNSNRVHMYRLGHILPNNRGIYHRPFFGIWIVPVDHRGLHSNSPIQYRCSFHMEHMDTHVDTLLRMDSSSNPIGILRRNRRHIRHRGCNRHRTVINCGPRPGDTFAELKNTVSLENIKNINICSKFRKDLKLLIIS